MGYREIEAPIGVHSGIWQSDVDKTYTIGQLYSAALMGKKAAKLQAATWNDLQKLLAAGTALELNNNETTVDPGVATIAGLARVTKALHQAGFNTWNKRREMAQPKQRTIVRAQAIDPIDHFNFTVSPKLAVDGSDTTELKGVISAFAASKLREKYDDKGILNVADYSGWGVLLTTTEGGPDSAHSSLRFTPEEDRAPVLGLDVYDDWYEIEHDEYYSKVIHGDARDVYRLADPRAKTAIHALGKAMIDWLTVPGLAVLSREVADSVS